MPNDIPTAAQLRSDYYLLLRDTGAGESVLGRYVGFANAMRAWDAASPGGEADLDDESLWIERERYGESLAQRRERVARERVVREAA